LAGQRCATTCQSQGRPAHKQVVLVRSILLKELMFTIFTEIICYFIFLQRGVAPCWPVERMQVNNPSTLASLNSHLWIVTGLIRVKLHMHPFTQTLDRHGEEENELSAGTNNASHKCLDSGRGLSIGGRSNLHVYSK